METKKTVARTKNASNRTTSKTEPINNTLPTKTKEFVGIATKYAEKGIPVVPYRGKRPVSATGGELAGWQVPTNWNHWDSPHVTGLGLLTGTVSGIVDLDIDDPSVLSLLNELPESLEIRRNGQTTHRLYRCSAAAAPTRQFRNPATNKMLLELRGDGCATMIPPSTHPKGGRLEWFGKLATMNYAELEERVSEIANRLSGATKAMPAIKRAPNVHVTKDRVTLAAAYLEKMDASISGAGGHKSLFRAACAMVRGFSLPLDTALMLLQRDFNPRCDPPWEEKEIRHKVLSARSARSLYSYGCLLPQVNHG